jgi:isoaspartyl peptidase/L-asparaginase-like protein (Ntn-hydrolase superfamily)
MVELEMCLLNTSLRRGEKRRRKKLTKLSRSQQIVTTSSTVPATTYREKFVQQRAGYDILMRKGTALDAVEAAVRVLESTRWFNAGKGSTANEDGFVIPLICFAQLMTPHEGC